MKISSNKGIKEPGNPFNRWGMICLGLFLLTPFSKAAHAGADPFGEYLDNHPRYEEYFRSLSDEQQDRIERQYLNQSQYRRAQA
ncbi:MAG TPA: hypothetical protein VD913_03655, partial [bacterium]|nr:hypothetical protein [bacterium]